MRAVPYNLNPNLSRNGEFVLKTIEVHDKFVPAFQMTPVVTKTQG